MLRTFWRHHHPGEWRTYCLTDRPEEVENECGGLLSHAIRSELPAEVRGWWAKPEVFAFQPQAPGHPMVYLDIDVIVIGALDPLAVDGLPPLLLLRDLGRIAQPDTCVMAWNRADAVRWLWDRFVQDVKGCTWADYCIPWPMLVTADGRKYRTDGAWTAAMVDPRGARAIEWRYVQDFLPGVVSFKYDLGAGAKRPSPGSTVISFHGKPKPSQAARSCPWVADLWSMEDEPARA